MPALAVPSTSDLLPARPCSPTQASPAAAHHPRLAHPAGLTTRSSVLQALAELSTYQAALDDELASLFHDHSPIVDAARRDIASVAPQIELVKEEAAVLDRRFQESASVAKRISERVRLLDEERKRIALATEWAVKVAELKDALLSLASAVEIRDWDQATAYCIKAMSIDPAITRSAFAASVVPTAELPESPDATLLSLRKTMLAAFTQSFKRATQSKDEAEASRFFKLFPQIGWKKEGLEVYSSFAKTMVREKGRAIGESLGSGKAQSPTYFALLLTALFEHLATLIDMHQPVVDRHYGSGNFGHGVMPGLQEECDRLGCRILDTWKEDRGVKRRLDEVNNYRFSGATAFRSPPPPFRPAFGAPGRTASPVGGRTGNASVEEPSGPDGREIDRILNELAAISSRWGLYRRFLHDRLQVDDEAKQESSQEVVLPEERETSDLEPLKDFRRHSLSSPRASLDQAKKQRSDGARSTQDDAEALPTRDIIAESQLGKQTDEALETIYAPMETWYLRNSLEKAFRIDQPDLQARPYTSSILDDAFYVLRTVLGRVLSTSSLSTVSDMFKAIRSVIEEDYIEVIVRKMENVWRSVSGSMTVDGPRKEAATREMRTVFVTYLNVLDVSAHYMERVLADVGNEESLARTYGGGELEQVFAIVHSLNTLVNRFKSGLRTEIDQLFTQITRPRLKTILTEAYRDISYVVDEDGYADAENRDLVRRRFIKGWEHVFHAFKGIYTENNNNVYVNMALDALLKPWESMVMGMRFSELGALRFDKDVRGISTFLATQTTLPIRDKFTRLQQISYVLNLDSSEDEGDVYQNAVASGISWRLTSAEVKTIQLLRL
ncbi:Golgi transport complex subunit 4 [Thecaphora frezii]